MNNFVKTTIVILILFVISFGCFGQCPPSGEFDQCEPKLTGMEIEPDCIEIGATAVLNLGWELGTLDLMSSCPVGSWAIQISFDALERYVYEGTVVGTEFDWTFDALNQTLTGLNNSDMTVDLLAGIIPQGNIFVILEAVTDNSCAPILSVANIQIIPLSDGGCPQAFSNNTANDSDQSALSTQAILPIELLYFEAIKKEKHTLLTWTTETEINNDHFDVQVSRDGIFFESIGYVKGSGTTYEERNYNFEHKTPFLGINYYRLKQIDFDGSFSYSEIRYVEFKENNDKLIMEVYPNPTHNLLSINTNLDLVNHNIQIFDNLGRRITIVDFENHMRINLRDYISGVYFLRLVNQNGYLVEQKSIIKVD